MIKTRTYFDHNIKIINLGDIHYGHPTCNRKAVTAAVDYIKRTPDLYWISIGDLCDVNLKSGKFFQHKALSLNSEIKELTSLLQPISHKCLGFVESNHHDRLEQTTGLSLDQVLASMIGLPFLGTFGRLCIRCDNISYYIAMHHGMGFGGTEGAKANNMMRLGNILRGYDVYCTGHTHCNDIKYREQRVLDRHHCRELTVTSLHACTGHYLTYDESTSYAAAKMLEPAPLGSTIITLKAAKSSAHKHFSGEFWTP